MKPSELTEEEKLKINELREKTGEPRLQCIMALSQCDGDIEKSIRWLNTRTFKSYIQVMKLKNTLLAFPLQFPLLFVLTFGVRNIIDLNIWWCVLIAFGINVLYDVGEIIRRND